MVSTRVHMSIETGEMDSDNEARTGIKRIYDDTLASRIALQTLKTP
jgi:hypothetical protein